MTDSEKLKWVAEHLATFRPLCDVAFMTYIDENGLTQDVEYEHSAPLGSDLELLEGCIELALKNESV